MKEYSVKDRVVASWGKGWKPATIIGVRYEGYAVRFDDDPDGSYHRDVSKIRVDMPKPKVVCLCGSTRFSETFQQANLSETLAGHIVLTIGCDMRSDADIFADKTPDELTTIKARLDELHLRKIDMADEVLILNVGGYIGESTRRELEYAKATGKHIRFLEGDSNAQ